MDYIGDIQPYESLGLTDDQIATYLSSFTRKNIPLGEVENFLDFQSLAKRSPITGNWEGILVNVIGGASQELSDGVSEFFVHLNKPRSEYINTTEEQWALKMQSLLAGLVAASVITPNQSADFVALGGGLKYGAVSAQDIANARQAHQDMMAAEEARRQQEEARFAVTEEFFAAYNTNVAPVLDQEIIEKAQLIEALRNAANQLEA